ncbi:hypothetical protein VTI74DRAFT_10656 [Chaetomium olivicolor]
MFTLDNFETGQHTAVQDVYQRCVLLSGKCSSSAALDNDDGYIVVETRDDAGYPSFPEQRWPMCRGYFKALVLLSPGTNKVVIRYDQNEDQDGCQTELSLRYTPLLQTPALHLAIMIASDSPLLIDCPPAKFGSLSSAHSSLSAAIAKFRMTAYMWQALTAEDFRQKGLGRRSFRLEEEWSLDTLSQSSLHCQGQTMASVPKIHLVRTPKTLAELRAANLAQQNPSARNKDGLHQIFTSALLAHGAPFTTASRPIVAGLILDSHYDAASSKLILAHAALGCHNPAGLSLGMFGSHLTYAWPRFMEEVSSCLMDGTPPGDTVGDDNGECGSMWRACAVGQGAFLHEVGHAFGAGHSSGIMVRGYSPDWVKVFIARVPGTGGVEVVTPEARHECRWDVGDALKFRRLRHFWLPGDREMSEEVPAVGLEDGKGDEMVVEIKCNAGIARVSFKPKGGKAVDDDKTSVAKPATVLRYSERELQERFGSFKTLGFEVDALNGKKYTLANLWALFLNRSFIKVPGTNIRLLKQCIGDGDGRVARNSGGKWMWAVMLKKRDGKGNLVDATKIDLRVGCALDGAEVYYADGEKIPCGPRDPDGNDPYMGGHQARKLTLAKDAEVVKVAVTRSEQGGWLQGLRMWLSNGKGMGALNCKSGQVETLVPPSNHKIIGFYGVSGRWGMCECFGIVTAPRDAVLPDSVYDLEELQNKPDGGSHRNKRRRVDDERMDDECDGDSESGGSCPSQSEDEDAGYDDGSDVEVAKWYKK